MESYVTKWLNEQDYGITNNFELIEMFVYSFMAFIVPFLLGHNQIITGIAVNAALVLAALNLKNEKLLPVIVLPSLGVLARGVVFGPFTMYLVYMVPFIWIGNLILVALIKKMYLSGKMNSVIALGLSASAKSGFLFVSAAVLVSYSVVPQIFLVTMGILQIATAIGGGFLGIVAHKMKKKVFSINTF